jgi:hypothetical protein
MKLKLFTFLLMIASKSFGQYIGVTAKYIDTRLVDNPGHNQSRENRLILSFYEVSPMGVYTPANLSNYDLYVWTDGLQYGNNMGGVLDSTGNNYPGYSYTAPRAVSSWNSYNYQYIDCSPFLATHYVVNGWQLDCGFIRVSYWETDVNGNENEVFTAPNVCLPYYSFGDPYYFTPGNVNFTESGAGPYNYYNFLCANGPLQLAIRGILPPDSGVTIVFLPVRFTNEQVEMAAGGQATVSWSNLSETNLIHYLVEKSADGISYQTIGTVLPSHNNGTRANYSFQTIQTDQHAYYRIKAVENNGGFFYSKIVAAERFSNVPLDPEQILSVYPNPIRDGNFSFRLPGAEKGRYVSYVVNHNGQQLKQKLVMHNGGDLARQVDLAGLPPGMYQFVLRGETKKYTQNILYVH